MQMDQFVLPVPGGGEKLKGGAGLFAEQNQLGEMDSGKGLG